MSDPILEKIQNELQLMNRNMADANDINTLLAYPTMPADLDNEGRKALRDLRNSVMQRAKDRTSAA